MSSAHPTLTGVWHGLYTYPGGFGSVSFGATLIEVASSLSGSTHEPCVFGDCTADTLFATLSGNREGTAITFVKTYDGTGGWSHSVQYAGMLSDDESEIEGQWRIGNTFGRFLMIRSTGRSIEVARKAFERL